MPVTILKILFILVYYLILLAAATILIIEATQAHTSHCLDNVGGSHAILFNAHKRAVARLASLRSKMTQSDSLIRFFN